MPEHFAFIGSDDPQAPGAVLLWSEGARILFNCPEGCQRFFGEISERLVAVPHVFFTQFTPHHTMGFPGMLFTINDAGVKHIVTTSPSSAATNNNHNNSNDEGEMQRWWGVLRRNYYSVNRVMDLAVDTSNVVSFPTFSVTTIKSPASPTNHSYLIQGTTALKFDPAQAKKLGVKPGPKYMQLKAGETVESDAVQGVFVKPQQVLVPNEHAEAEERNVLLADYNNGWEEYDGIMQRAESELAAAVARGTGSSTRIHTVIHLARFPNSFLVHKMMQIRDRIGVSTIDELSADSSCCSPQDEAEEKKDIGPTAASPCPSSMIKGFPLCWTERITVRNGEDDSCGDFEYIRRHVIAPTCVPPDSVRVTAFPTSLAMRMHLKAVTDDLFTPNSVSVMPATSSSSSPSSSPCSRHGDDDDHASEAPKIAWPYGPSCFLKLRVPPLTTKSANPSSTSCLFRFPGNHLLLPNRQQALEMLSPELRRRFEQKQQQTKMNRLAKRLGNNSDCNNNNNLSKAPIKWLSFGGTGSAVPNKYRNVSSIALEYYRDKEDNGNVEAATNTILLDCGEGTSGQFALSLGNAGFVDEFIPKLKFIFISHMHADHHFGLFSILALASKHKGKILPVIAPNEVHEYFKQMLNDWGTANSSPSLFGQEVGELNKNFIFIDSQDVVNLVAREFGSATIEEIVHYCRHHGETADTRRAVQAAFPIHLSLASLPRIKVFAVEHPGSAHGIRLDFAKLQEQKRRADAVFPSSLIYTGDTRPSQRTVDAINSCSGGIDILIHESTFDSSMKEEAAAKMHSTVDEAIGVAERAGAVKFLMLNHFSQRYPKLSTGARIDKQPGEASNGENAAVSNAISETKRPTATMMIGASCDLLFLQGRLEQFQELQDSLPYFAELLEEYDKFAGGGSLSRRLRSGMTTTDKTSKNVVIANS